MSVKRFAQWLLLSIILTLLTIGLTHWQLQQQLESSLRVTLSPVISAAYQDYLVEAGIDSHIVNRLNWSFMDLAANTPYVQQISLEVASLRASTSDWQVNSVVIPWQDMLGQQALRIDFHLHYDYVLLLLTTALCAFGVVLADYCASCLTPQRQRQIRQAWRSHPWDIRHLLDSLNTTKQLRIDLATQTVWANQTAIKMSKTPFFYYLWYAQLRQQDANEGWFINPAAEHGNHVDAQSLIALMQTHGGHPRAVNDLISHGLRAKTLDQNRNKIKDEFLQELDAELAETYLFEAKRDLKTGRYMHRLILEKQQIIIQ